MKIKWAKQGTYFCSRTRAGWYMLMLYSWKSRTIGCLSSLTCVHTHTHTHNWKIFKLFDQRQSPFLIPKPCEIRISTYFQWQQWRKKGWRKKKKETNDTVSIISVKREIGISHRENDERTHLIVGEEKKIHSIHSSPLRATWRGENAKPHLHRQFAARCNYKRQYQRQMVRDFVLKSQVGEKRSDARNS